MGAWRGASVRSPSSVAEGHLRMARRPGPFPRGHRRPPRSAKLAAEHVAVATAFGDARIRAIAEGTAAAADADHLAAAERLGTAIAVLLRAPQS
ncbi:MAG: hypothetical protein R2789_04365 [Microthrixaceae bacterium]